MEFYQKKLCTVGIVGCRLKGMWDPGWEIPQIACTLYHQYDYDTKQEF